MKKKNDIEPVNISIHFDKPDDSIEIDFDAITDPTERANKMFQHSLRKYPNPKKNIKKSGPITKLFFELKNEKLCDKIRKIYACNNELVGQRIVNINNNPKRYDWIKVYHGTKYEYLKSIFKNGLKKPGETYYDNKKIKLEKVILNLEKHFIKLRIGLKLFLFHQVFFILVVNIIRKELNLIVRNGVLLLKLELDHFRILHVDQPYPLMNLSKMNLKKLNLELKIKKILLFSLFYLLKKNT